MEIIGTILKQTGQTLAWLSDSHSLQYTIKKQVIIIKSISDLSNVYHALWQKLKYNIQENV